MCNILTEYKLNEVKGYNGAGGGDDDDDKAMNAIMYISDMKVNVLS